MYFSPSTVRLYENVLRQFYEFLQPALELDPQGDITGIRTRHILSGLCQMGFGEQCTELTTPKAYFAFLEEDPEWRIPDNPAKGIRQIKYNRPLLFCPLFRNTARVHKKTYYSDYPCHGGSAVGLLRIAAAESR